MHKEIIGDATLYLGDCLEILPSLPGGVADLILTDPPYGVEFVGRAGVHGMLVNDHKGFDVTPYIAEALRCLRRHRHVYVFGPLDISKLKLCSPAELIWDKEMFGLGNLAIPWGCQHEKITFAIYETGKAAREGGSGILAARLRRGSVLRCLRPNSQRASVHPTEKPVDILAQMIESSSMLGETVLDPFMGSGSTVVAALAERRKAIGVEIDPKYFDIACRRIEQAQKQLKLAL
ncbi:MAG: site-specific DNA-methyltransferase [Bacteroidales bacterium]|nr:site-specific DNA-methyltransferase [Bacteroidales bacterium]